jgi:hypothetical protein
MGKEHDETIAKARSLRSNEQMVKDQIKKVDEETIRELSRLRHQVLPSFEHSNQLTTRTMESFTAEPHSADGAAIKGS